MSRNKRKKNLKPKIILGLKIFFIIGLVSVLIGGSVALFLINKALKNVEPIDPSNINALLFENSVILDNKGNELENLSSSNERTLIKYNEISPHVINAYVSIEDKTFFEHSGFNFIRIIGAVKDSVFKNKRIGGTSTITQQLAKNLYLTGDRTIERKIQEAYYAIQLEKHLTKEQILEAYLNTISLGSNASGVQAASQKYFSKNANDLNVLESAILAAIPKGPSIYSPTLQVRNENVTEDQRIVKKVNEYYTLVYNPRCENRVKLVLKLMKDNGYINKKEYNEAVNKDFLSILNPNIEKGHEISSYFSDMVEKEVIDDLMSKYNYSKSEAINYLYTGGLKIHSTIDFDMQKTLENAYASTNFTEYFGQNTKDAVRRFQKSNNLTADGMAGKNTLNKLKELNVIQPDEISLSALVKGKKHPEVKVLKRALHELGFFNSNDLFPKIKVFFDSNKNIITEDNRRIVLYKYSNLIDKNQTLTLKNDDFFFNESGDLVLKRNKKLNFYSHYDKDGNLSRIQVVIKNLFKYNESDKKITRNYDGSYNISELFTYQGRDILIPDEFKSYDENKNVVISKSFLDSDENFIKIHNGNLYIEKGNYAVQNDGTIQPQSAMVIIDYRTGHLKALVGGRNITGQKIFNRALNPRQPGSSVKPFAVYTPAIASKNYTAASVIDDVPSYLSGSKTKRWPLNWYENYGYKFKYRGISTLREGIEQSMNVVTAKLAQNIGVETCIESMKNFGISTIVDSGRINDHNLSTVSLGGMTKGISPIELARAYGTYGNNGIQVDTVTYTKVVDPKGNVILKNIPNKRKVIDANLSFIIRDMMRTGVTRGVASKAKIRAYNTGIPVAGKTGTTSKNYDAWFSGMTPYYAGVTWFGTDYNMSLNNGSAVSAEFWSYVMKNIHEDLEDKNFEKPKGVLQATVDTKSGKLPTELSYLDPRNTVKSEYFLPGTIPTKKDDVHVQIPVCKESGLLATEYCPATLVENKVFTNRLDGEYNPKEHLNRYGNPILIEDQEYSVPTEQCNVHGEMIYPPGSNPGNITIDNSDYLKYNEADETYIVIKGYAILLNSGNTIYMPVGTKITQNKDVIFPDGSVFKSDKIENIPYLD